MIDPTPPGHLSPTATLLVIAIVLMTLAVAFAWAVFWWVTQKRRAAEAVASVTSGTPPPRGSVVLHGTVETEAFDRPAITVTLREQGEETEGKNGWSHTWTEQRRETRAEPFYLALSGSSNASSSGGSSSSGRSSGGSSGSSGSGGSSGVALYVRVEPDEDVFLVDTLDPLEGGNPRTRRAQLTHGETAYVTGIIGRGWHARSDSRRSGAAADAPHEAHSNSASASASASASHASPYRGGPTDGLVLRPGRDRMLVSTEPLDRRYVRQAKAHRTFAVVLGVALVLASTVLFGATIVIELFGKTLDADVVAARHWTTSGKSGPNHHYAVTARYQDSTGRTIELDHEVNRDTYDLWQQNRLPRLQFIVAFDNPTLSNVGERARLWVGLAIVAVFVTLCLLLVYRAALNGAREWYDKRIVVTRGAGRLVL